ncbi:S1 family peptidase [Lentzea terrae]|uniref:S1 family peptidase n=1 Tax=Lentzea terrae TaxID=2200761 RepID=UPI0013009418|nr:serine protease [Lentzea terrae]
MAGFAGAAAAAPPPPVDETGPVQPYVVGGRDATEAYGFVASLQLPVSGELRHFCTGSLITRRWVVTAAHCVKDRILPGTTKVLLGSNDRTAGGTLAGVSRVVVHQKFDMNKPGYDVAMVELDQPVPYRPVLLASRAGKVGSLSRIMGWGVVCDADLNDPVCRQAPKVLQELDTKRLPDQRCMGIDFFDRARELCIGDRNDEARQACFGDSGGPLVQRVRGRWMLIGATTGDGDDTVMRPRVCTTAPDGANGVGIWQDLPTYRSWIAQTIWECDRQEGENVQAQMREADALMAAA